MLHEHQVEQVQLRPYVSTNLNLGVSWATSTTQRRCF
ncbi:hypothetical protein ACP70R_001556 [Stipagrostis hirtigluma subsp. patula]